MGPGSDGRRTGTTAAPAGSGAALDQLRLGFAYIGPINDNGWTQEHHRGASWSSTPSATR